MRNVAVLILLALVALAGCGPGDDLVDRHPELRLRESSTELAGSPGATALAWWDSARARNAEGLLARLTPAARRTVDPVTLRAALEHSFGRYAESTEAKVLYTERRPGGATVYMRIDGGTLIGPVLVRGGATMLALPFVSRGGHWLIENGAYLRAQANSYLAVRELYRKIKRESLREQAQEEEEDK